MKIVYVWPRLGRCPLLLFKHKNGSQTFALQTNKKETTKLMESISLVKEEDVQKPKQIIYRDFRKEKKNRNGQNSKTLWEIMMMHNN